MNIWDNIEVKVDANEKTKIEEHRSYWRVRGAGGRKNGRIRRLFQKLKYIVMLQ